jgi:hypothetical protein
MSISDVFNYSIPLGSRGKAELVVSGHEYL